MLQKYYIDYSLFVKNFIVIFIYAFPKMNLVCLKTDSTFLFFYGNLIFNPLFVNLFSIIINIHLPKICSSLRAKQVAGYHDSLKCYCICAIPAYILSLFIVTHLRQVKYCSIKIYWMYQMHCVSNVKRYLTNSGFYLSVKTVPLK